MWSTYDEKSYEDSQNEEKLARCKFLGPKVKLIFILSILQIICNVLSNEKVALISLGLYLVGLFAGLVVGIVYGVVMLSMARESERFKMAGIFYLLSPILGVVAAFMGQAMTVIVSIAVIILAFVALYQEIYGFSETLSGINNNLSMRWPDIWKKLMFWLIALLVSFGVMLLASVFGYAFVILGSIGMIVSAIAVIVVSIMRIIAISDTANAFNNFVQFHN